MDITNEGVAVPQDSTPVETVADVDGIVNPVPDTSIVRQEEYGTIVDQEGELSIQSAGDPNVLVTPASEIPDLDVPLAPVFQKGFQEPEAMTSLEEAGAGFSYVLNYENILGSKFRQMSEQERMNKLPDDPDFSLDEYYNKHSAKLNPMLMEQLYEANSEAQANSIMQSYETRVASMSDAASGWGMASMITGGIALDPFTLIPATKLYGLAKTTSRAANSARVAGETAAAGTTIMATQEFLLHATDSNRTAHETATAIAGGMVLGGGMGAVAGAAAGPSVKVMGNSAKAVIAAQNASADTINKSSQKFDKIVSKHTDTAETFFDGNIGKLRVGGEAALNPKPRGTFVDGEFVPSDVQPKAFSGTEAAAGGDFTPEAKSFMDEATEQAADYMDRANFSDEASLLRSTDYEVKAVALALFEPPAAHGSQRTVRNAGVQMEQYNHSFRGQGWGDVRAGYELHAKELGLGMDKANPTRLKEYYDGISETIFMRDAEAQGFKIGKDYPKLSDGQQKALAGITDTTRKIADDSVANKVLTAGKRIENYLPRKIKAQKLLQLGDAKALRLIKLSMASDDIKVDDIPDLVALKFLDHVRNQLDSGSSVNVVKEVDIVDSLSGEVLDILKEGLKSREINYNKSRLGLNLFAEDVDGNRLFDMMDTNINRTMGQYIEQMAGANALSHHGFRTAKQLQEYVNERILKRNTDLTTNQRDILENMENYFSGRPISEGIHPALRRLRQVTGNILLGGMGLSTLADLQNVLATFGVNGLKKNDVFKNYLKSLKPGKEAYEFRAQNIKELESVGFGRIGKEHETYYNDFMLDEVTYHNAGDGKVKDAVSGNTWDMIDTGLHEMTYFTGRWTGFHKVRSANQKLALDALGTNVAYHALFDHKLVRGLSPKRLRQLGVSDEQFTGIVDQVKKHADHSDGKLNALNLHKWDKGARDAYFDMNTRVLNRTTQKTINGEGAIFEFNPSMQMLMQFLNHPLQAFTKQFLRNVKAKDAETVAAVAWGFTMSYAMQALRQVALAESKLTEGDRDASYDRILGTDMNESINAIFTSQGYNNMLPFIDAIKFSAEFMGLDPAFDGGGLPIHTVMKRVKNLPKDTIGADSVGEAVQAGLNVTPLGGIPLIRASLGLIARPSD